MRRFAANAVRLQPHALAYNAEHAPEAMTRIAQALGSRDAAQAAFDLAAAHGAPTSLRAIGMPEDGLDQIRGWARTQA